MANQKTFLRWWLILGTCVTLVLLYLLWFTDFIDFTPLLKLVATITLVSFIIGRWVLYFRQKKNDVSTINPGSGDVLKTPYKISGYWLKLRAAFLIIAAIFILIFAFMSFTGATTDLFIILPAAIIIIGFISMAWVSWQRSKALQKGRFY